MFLTISDATTAEKMYEEFVSDYPDHLPFHTAFLQVLDPLDVKRAFPTLTSKNYQINNDAQSKIITICEKALDNISEDSILAFTAMKTDLRPEASKIKTLVLKM